VGGIGHAAVAGWPERKGSTAMPEGSTKKQKRQYEHIKESYQERGVSSKEAKERAARTVNKQKGKSKSKS
jgi:hypothetical protein